VKERYFAISAALSFAAMAAGCADPGTAAISAKRNGHSILKEHDPHGRFANTQIKFVGTVNSGTAAFDVYDLNFINSVAKHGMQRVAIVHGPDFIGSYQTDGAEIEVGNDGIRFIDAHYKSDDFMPVRDGKFPKEHLINGAIRSLEPNI
jgi:phosphate-selective porin